MQRWVTAIAERAGIGHVHPHRLRHTLATGRADLFDGLLDAVT